MLLQALAGSPRDAAAACGPDDGAGGWSLQVPEPGAVLAGDCLHSVDVLSHEALVAARSRLNPAAGVMLSALWVPAAGQLVLIIHHLAIDGVSWRILLEDFNIAWAQHQTGQPAALPAGGTSFARWASLLAEHARRPEVVEQADAWRQVAATPPALPAVQPAVDTYASAGRLSASLDVETTRMLLGEVPAAFHAGIHEILLIAFGLAWTEFLGISGQPRHADRHRGRGPRPPRGAGPRCGPDPHRGVVHHQVPGVSWTSVDCPGRRWPPGRRGWGRCQGRQRAAAGAAGSVDLRCAALFEQRCRAGRVGPGHRVQLPGTAGWGGRPVG